MGVYALFLGSSSYLAPVMCGFINDGQGYQWVFYWFSIFLGIAFVFLFFFMEETNYDRATIGVVEDTTIAAPTSDISTIKVLDEKDIGVSKTPASTPDIATGQTYTQKTFWQKMALKDPPRPQRFFHRIKQQLVFLSWPVIFYAG